MMGDKMRELREADPILLRQLTAPLAMETAMRSKRERGDRFFRKEDIVALQICKQQPEERLTLWWADTVLKIIANEEHKKQALALAIKTWK